MELIEGDRIAVENVEHKGSKVEKSSQAEENNLNNKSNIKVVSWNARSLNSLSKAKIILKEEPDIGLVQEIWHPDKNVVDLFPENRIATERQDAQGGGTMTFWKMDALKQIGKALPINQDSVIAKYTIADNRIIWLSSIYINKGTKKAFMETISKVQEHVPEYEWPYILLCGDWNINIAATESRKAEEEQKSIAVKRAEAVKMVAKQMGLKIYYIDETRNESTIDYIIAGNALQIETIQVKENRNLSDHKILSFTLETKQPSNGNRMMKIPDRKLAESFTINSLEESANAIDFLEAIQKRMRSKDNNIMKKIKRKPYKKELLEKIMQLYDEDSDLKQIIQEYWTEKAQENEESRFCEKSKEAFNFLKKTFRYHEYNRRDGSIISKVVNEDGTITHDEEEVSKKILEALKAIQFQPEEKIYRQTVPFPNLPALSNSEIEEILNSLSTNKAIAYDGMTDSIFKKQYRKFTIPILKDIWNGMAKNKNIPQSHFDARLIPLNKIHPEIPKPKDCRPIIVSSPLIKLLESRLKKKLDQYMTSKLVMSQTGFVPHNGITVNQTRLVERITLRTKNQESRRRLFGLFIDFSSAYNTILHSKLFDRLKKVLDQDEIQLIQAIYSRNRIRLGKETLTPNIGLAQGSVISPALFNIYCEELYEKINVEADVPLEDLLGYADDLLILCSSQEQLRKAIRIIRKWSMENNLKLNERKSGIVEFLPKYGKTGRELTIGKNYEGIPVVESYKYLGVQVDSKLTLNPQLSHIESKTNYIYFKLWPVLNKVSLDYRINLWNMLIKPLFEMCLSLYTEISSTNQEATRTMIRKTFRKLTLLKKNVSRDTVEKLMDFDFDQRVAETMEVTKVKWEARKRNVTPEYPTKETMTKNLKKKLKILYPKELQEMLNISTAVCNKCRVPCGPAHMVTEHKIYIPDTETVLQRMKEINEKGRNQKANRKAILRNAGEYLKPFLSSMKEHLNNYR
jgi:hypothetical protein